MSKEILMYIPVTAVTANPFQPRREFKQKEIEELAESIDQQGLIQPITVRELEKVEGEEPRYELVAGERRLRAVRDILGKTRIQAIVKILTNSQSQEMALIENIQRQDLNPMEEAMALQAIMDNEGLTQEQLAKRIGKSRSNLGNTLRLLRLPEEVKELVATGKLDKVRAWSLLSLPTPQDQTKIAKHVVEKNWTREKLQHELDKFGKESGETEPTAPKKVGRKPIKVPYTKNLVLVEFGDVETVNEFVAYLIEQGITCWRDETVLQALKERENKPDTANPTEEIDLFTEVENHDENPEVADI